MRDELNMVDLTKVKVEELEKPSEKTKKSLSQKRATLKLNPQNFDWFMAGIDKERIVDILEHASKIPIIKMEEPIDVRHEAIMPTPVKSELR